MASNHQQHEAARAAANALRELAKGLLPGIANLNNGVIELQKHLTPEQRVEFDKHGISQQTEAVTKRLDELQSEIFKTRK